LIKNAAYSDCLEKLIDNKTFINFPLNYFWQQKTLTYSIKRSTLSSSDHQFASLFAPILVVLWRAGGAFNVWHWQAEQVLAEIEQKFRRITSGSSTTIRSNNDEKLKGLRYVEFEPGQ
jgi:hypothetical protein